MEPYATARVQVDPEWSPGKYSEPEPQNQLVDFRSGQRISEVAAFAARLLMDGLAKWSGPAKISDIRCEVDPGDPSKLNFTYNIAIPFLRFDFIVSPPKPIPVTMEVAVKPTEVVMLDPVTLTERISHPLDDEEHGCRVPGCGRPRNVEFNVMVLEDDHEQEWRRGSSCDAPGHRAYVEAALHERHVGEPAPFHAADGCVCAGVALTPERTLPAGSVLIKGNRNPDYYALPPTCQADIDALLVGDPDITEIVFNPRDLSAYMKATARTVEGIRRALAPFQAEPACECGSEKTGLPTHSSWCPKGKP